MDFKEYQRLSKISSFHGDDISTPIAKLAELTGDLNMIWGTWCATQPSLKITWPYVRSVIREIQGDMLWNLTDLATLLKVELDTEIAKPAQCLKPTGSKDVGVLIGGVAGYVGKLCGVYAKYLEYHTGRRPLADEIATSIRISNAQGVGPVMLSTIIALFSAMTELRMRCELPLEEVLTLSLERRAKIWEEHQPKDKDQPPQPQASPSAKQSEEQASKPK